LGDFIDRGPSIARVLQIARGMVESGSAMAVLGNHELNAIAFQTVDPQTPGGYMRHRSASNVRQHQATLDQLSTQEMTEAIRWFRTLPLAIELPKLRVIHACWSNNELNHVQQSLDECGGMTDEFIRQAYRHHHPLYRSVEVVVKGREARLPSGYSFEDKEGKVRTTMRTRWYLSPEGHTYQSYAMQADMVPCRFPLADDVVQSARPYAHDAPPVFIGHYWQRASKPTVLAHNVACLDYSVAKGGFLCAYRWNGETELSDDAFVC
jgi:hypothetical protein